MIVRILRGAIGGLARRRHEVANTICHASKPEQASAFSEVHQFVRQIKSAVYLVPACALASLPGALDRFRRCWLL